MELLTPICRGPLGVPILESSISIYGDVLKHGSRLGLPLEASDVGYRESRSANCSSSIRNSARDAIEKWLLNKDKEMDIRLGMTASILDEIFNDANLPIHYGPLCLQIQTALEALLNEVKQT